MRRRARVDENQQEIGEGLRELGVSVAYTHMVGDGFPDIVAGWLGSNFLLEVKDGNKPPSRRRLTKDESKFRRRWRGHYAVVESLDDAILAVMGSK